MTSEMEAEVPLLDSLSNATGWLQFLTNCTFSPNASVRAMLTNSQFLEANLVEILGPKRSPFFFPVTSVYLLIFLVGLSGNLLTCTVMARHKKMRNPTNLYLLSLALSDLLVLLFGMPLEIYELWQNYPFPFGEGGCYFKTFLLETVCFASILNVTALSVERYIAVLHPLKTRYLSTNQHVKRVISVVWVVSMVCAVPNTSLHGLFYLPQRMAESTICTVLKPIWIYNMIMQITTVCFFFVPMMVISVLYLVMGLHLARERGHSHRSLEENSVHGKMAGNGRKTQVNKMLCEFDFLFFLSGSFHKRKDAFTRTRSKGFVWIMRIPQRQVAGHLLLLGLLEVCASSKRVLNFYSYVFNSLFF